MPPWMIEKLNREKAEREAESQRPHLRVPAPVPVQRPPVAAEEPRGGVEIDFEIRF